MYQACLSHDNFTCVSGDTTLVEDMSQEYDTAVVGSGSLEVKALRGKRNIMWGIGRRWSQSHNPLDRQDVR